MECSATYLNFPQLIGFFLYNIMECSGTAVWNVPQLIWNLLDAYWNFPELVEFPKTHWNFPKQQYGISFNLFEFSVTYMEIPQLIGFFLYNIMECFGTAVWNVPQLEWS